jgi:opacity protein-like surface antigen
MKNQILKYVAIVLFFALSFGARAQYGDRIWSIGLEVGPNFSKYGWDGKDSDFKTGFLLGGNLTYSIRNTYGFTGKVLYAQKGAKEGSTKSTLNYVEVPVVARLFFNEKGPFRPNIFAGPSFGFLTGVKAQTGNGDKVTVDNYKDTFKTFDFGLTGGLGLNYEIAPETHILVDIRYTYGLTDVSKTNSSSVNNQVVSVTAGFSIGI